MYRQFGSKKDHQPGLLAPLHFPQLARMDEWTSDGRRLQSAGGGVRELPRTIYFQFDQGPGGHVGSVAIGRLDLVQFSDVSNTDPGLLSGDGWAVDMDDARKAVALIQLGAVRGNSVDLADTDYEVDFDGGDLRLTFTQWAVGATTVTGKPAFANARVEAGDTEVTASLLLDQMLEEAGVRPSDAGEVVASAGGPIVVQPWDAWTVRAPAEVKASVQPERIVVVENETKASAADEASATIAQPGEDYYIDEPDSPQPITVDADGRVFGHLGDYNRPHRSVAGGVRYIPRSRDNYADFLNPGVLVEFESGERRIIETAPLMLSEGHPGSVRGLTAAEIDKLYGGTENAWADIRIVDGKHGPWMCGRVRPGQSLERVHRARASRISGHWLDDQLVAIVSVNVNGYPVKGSGTNAQYSERLNDEGQLEVVASFAPPVFIDEDGVEGDAPTSPTPPAIPLDTDFSALADEFDID